jgi:diguanylate cyclase (GGDEF)-like protein
MAGMPRPRLLQFSLRSLLLGSAAIAALLLVVVLVPQTLSRQARLQVLRAHVDEVARLAASQVDGDLHRRLIDGTVSDEASRQLARAQLLRLHASWPEAIYVYTMGARDGAAFFVLDTAQDAAFAKLRGLRESKFLEPFLLRREYASNWLDELAAGRTYVNEGFQHDDYGYFLSGHAPIRDSAGRVAGFAGVDFDLNYYVSEEARFRQIEIASVACSLVLALLLGYVFARYRFSQDAELQQHFESSMQDALTGLPNRRGALAAIDAVWSRAHDQSHAVLLVDIDNFKTINDSRGHATGDEVIRSLASALRACLRPGDVAARLGGDEFMIFARNCDLRGAEQIAAQLLAAVRHATDAPMRFGVSVGISVTATADGGFDELYRQADAALYRSKNEGRNRYSVFLLA